MAELRAMAEGCGFADARTYIASGNLVFRTSLPADAARNALERALEGWAGKPVPVFLRTPAELDDILAANPFPDAPGNRCLVTFLDAPPPEGWQSEIRHRKDEEIAAIGREIYIHYGDGMGQSRLVIPAARSGTARNLNTIRKLVEMAG